MRYAVWADFGNGEEMLLKVTRDAAKALEHARWHAKILKADADVHIQVLPKV